MGKLRNAIVSCLLLAVPLVTGACKEREERVETPVRVQAGPPVVRDIDVTLGYPVELEADEEVSITPVAISGFLRKVVVDVGDEVEAGQLIALVDCREYAAQRTQAETAIAKWEAQVDESSSQLQRLTRMGDKLVAAAEVERAQAEARVAEAELADARAKLSEAGQRQGYCSLRAPFSGFVSQRFLDPGAMVRPGGEPVVNLVKTKEVRVVANVIEQDAPSVMRGARVDVEFHAFPDTLFRAEVARVGRSLDDKTRTLRVEMELPNTTEVLLPGMTGQADIVIGKREKALLVPLTAILKLEEKAYAYVVADGGGRPVARRVEVTLGVEQGDWIEVREGLAPTDTVIAVGRELVDEGTWVEIVESSQQPPAPKTTPAPEAESVSTTGASATTADPTPDADPDSELGEDPADKRDVAGDAPAVDPAKSDLAATKGGKRGKERRANPSAPADREPLRPKRDPVGAGEGEAPKTADPQPAPPEPSAAAGSPKEPT